MKAYSLRDQDRAVYHTETQGYHTGLLAALFPDKNLEIVAKAYKRGYPHGYELRSVEMRLYDGLHNLLNE